jgi:hypothetical protein
VSSLQDIRDLGFFCLMGILTPLRFFFWYLETTYPPIFKCYELNDVKTFPYTITIWKIWGGLTFQSLVDFPYMCREFEGFQRLPFILKGCDVNVGIFVKNYYIMPSHCVFYPTLWVLGYMPMVGATPSPSPTTIEDGDFTAS